MRLNLLVTTAEPEQEKIPPSLIQVFQALPFPHTSESSFFLPFTHNFLAAGFLSPRLS